MIRKLLTVFLTLAASLAALATDLTSSEIQQVYANAFSNAVPTRGTSHDPSVVIGYEADGKVYATPATGRKKIYCVFGSHRAWLKSYDLQNWTEFTNNLSTNYSTIFAEDAKWSAHGSSTYDVAGNMWAPDVVWNEVMQKWCMYMSINGDSFYSSIVLLTAESLTGDWTRVGTVIYSLGSSNKYASETDVWSVLDKDNDSLDRYYYYRNSVNNHTYGTNAIDPCVFYDNDGNLWMSYGSWFGGIYMIRLDKSTGLRDYTYTYDTNFELASGSSAGKMNVNWAKSDAYQGIKIAGGNHCSGEASYIEYHDGLYWLFVSYGALNARGGYSMRVFSSESVTGPYTDVSGDDARYSLTGTNGSTNAGQINKSVGTRLMSYYRWGFMDYGFTAQGHNSAVVDTDGRMFLVYHTRFDDGTEGHQVRVHQLFTSGKRILCAPFEFRGESISSSAYSAADVAGYYGIIRHGNGTDYANLECAAEQVVYLSEDGTVSGAYSGTWSVSSSAPDITVAIMVGSSTETYYGKLIEQNIEETNVKTLCFTAVDDYDKSLWGYKRGSETSTFPANVQIAMLANQLSDVIPSKALLGSTITLPAEQDGVSLTYKSQDESVMTSDGQISSSTTAKSAKIDVTLTCGDYSYSLTHTISLLPSLDDVLALDPSAILAHYSASKNFETQPQVSVSQTTGLSLSFMVSDISSDWTEIARSADGKYLLYLSVLHYDATNYFEHLGKLSSAATATGLLPYQLFLNGTYYVTVSYNPDGSIGYYRDGTLMLTFDDTCSPADGSLKPSEIVKSVIADYLAGNISFSTAVDDVVVGYSAKYTTEDIVSTCPVAENSLLTSSFSNVYFNLAEPADGVTDETGVSFSFLASGLTSDWNAIAKSADGQFVLYPFVLHYGTTDYYEHNGIATSEAQSLMSAESKGLWQLMLDGSYYLTFSYNPDGSICCYRNGVLIVKYDDSCTAGYSSGTAAKPSEIVKAVVAAYNEGSISFDRSVTNLKVGYAVGYEPGPTAVDSIDAASDSEVVSTSVYTLGGARIAAPQRGINVIVKRLADGSSKSLKLLVK